MVTGKGSQFISNAILKFVDDRKFNRRCIARDKLSQIAFKENFNGHLRDLLLNKTLFLFLNDARVTFAALRHDDNTDRPHSRHVWPTQASLSEPLPRSGA